jgi:hypothetical protein
LTQEDLRHALAVESDDKFLDWENFVDAQLLIDCCLGLVIVDDSTSTIRLVHKSLQDYLEAQYKKRQIFTQGHYEIARICLTYMTFDSYDLNESDPELWYETYDKHPLLNYAARQWDHHARNSEAPDDAMGKIVFTVLDQKIPLKPVFLAAFFIGKCLIRLLIT